MNDTQNAITEIATESPEAAGMIGAIIQASADSTFRTMDTLYEGERQRRQALEVLIEQVLDGLDRAHMGSAREYEQAVKPLRLGILQDEERRLAAMHYENAEA